ncbi:DUF4825 domain-containing protein [Psychrobacillus sp. NPDC096426]|uniref:DUF4825 domain-containing protein n=1 Tax=Psychrobacillus sp. NPDC096426 TaxID=3364491 RepID=UPI00381522E2
MKDKLIACLFIVGLIMFAWMQIVYFPGQEKLQEEASLKQLNPETHDFNKVLKYENLYMGNAGNNINLFGNLPLTQHQGTFEMDSDQFLLIINYTSLEGESERTVQQSVIYNTTAAFVLIKNLQQIEMRFPDESFIVQRGNVEKWFGSDLSDLTDPIQFKEKVQEPLKKNNLKEWLATYTGQTK